MAHVVRMPKLGMEMERGVLLEWHVEPGERVEADEVVAEVESEKSTAEVAAREGGVLRAVLLDPGEEAEPGTPMGVVAGETEAIDDLLAGLDAPAGAAEPADVGGSAGTTGQGGGEPTDDSGGPVRATTRVGDEPAGATGRDDEPTGDRPARVTPRARRRAAELGVDPATAEGSGTDGAVVAADVERAAGVAAGDGPRGEHPTGATEPSPVTPDAAVREPAGSGSEEPARGPDTPGVREERELGGMRRTIARRLGQSSREAAHVTASRDVPAGELLDAAAVADRGLDADVSFPDVLLLAVSATLDEHGAFNATFEEEVHRLHADQNVGVAVDVEDGLVAPVLRAVGRKSLAELAGARRDAVELARSGEYTMDDLSGGTFTVTNLGALGVDAFTPIVNPPQVAILGVNRVREVPARGEDGTVAFERRVRLDLSFDHRVVDGADAARFLGALAEHVRDPWPLLLDRT